ncbi:Hsp20/alpha crystallin family protein [Candidatus Babeliales bacterium]|nr:Hsp20/alpha crystallin family protein [Candidatus Babeliales bacterium]
MNNKHIIKLARVLPDFKTETQIRSNTKGEIKMKLVRYNPYRMLGSVPMDINRFFSDFGLDPGVSDTIWNPSVDVSENDDSYEINAELPGINRSNIEISVHSNVLSVSGEKKQEKEEQKKNYYRMERSYGRFQRSFHLPEDVNSEDIKAKYKKGVLTVTIPKSEEKKPKEIEVS